MAWHGGFFPLFSSFAPSTTAPFASPPMFVVVIIIYFIRCRFLHRREPSLFSLACVHCHSHLIHPPTHSSHIPVCCLSEKIGSRITSRCK